ncbi:substrate-binding domain-containing protein [Natranaeroarchaeum aerophilus]|uniref:Substrate-binding domain-containing protein n=1 Tax=Natranaeroarchaeum aerophilus TaxID=2917711 RepID=A0AAE3FSG6_9EURY|nr:substrate-binding domain-containing protein [Natranaeroarchaeum aerophilus]MCL9814479.1 substrate-binding domain-containing protein [Natranaeroarchaeum aerophilus]
MHRREFVATLGGGTAVAIAGCSDTDDSGDAGITDETLTLTTTTSTYDTGLVDELNLAFEERFGTGVAAVNEGTGAALETGRRGDADVVMVHARSLEDEFIREGYGVNRRDLMYNDFVVVGPDDDPAGIDGMDDVTEAFRAIADSESVFVSRGDSSGTHTKELELWDAAGMDPGGEWYREAGSGMGQVLVQADQSEGYTLADRGTFLSMRSQLGVGIRVEGPIEEGPELLANPYGIVAVNPAVHDNVAYDLALAYIGFLTSRVGQDVIESYTVEGEQLFFPRALSEEPNFEQYLPEDWTREEC